MRFDHVGSLDVALVKLATVQIDVQLTHLLSDHIDGILRSAIRDDRDDRCINDAEVLDTVDAELWIDDSLLDGLRQTGRSARV